MAIVEREYARVAAWTMRLFGTKAAAVEEDTATKAEANMVTLIALFKNVRRSFDLLLLTRWSGKQTDNRENS